MAPLTYEDADMVAHLEGEKVRLDDYLVHLVSQVDAIGELLGEAVATSARLRRPIGPGDVLASADDRVDSARLRGLMLRATACRWSMETMTDDEKDVTP